jgi:hypothetical protein
MDSSIHPDEFDQRIQDSCSGSRSQEKLSMRLRSNAMLDRKIVYHAGHRRLRQPNMSCQFLKAYAFAPDYIRSRVMACRFFSHMFTSFPRQPEIMERRIEIQFFRV